MSDVLLLTPEYVHRSEFVVNVAMESGRTGTKLFQITIKEGRIDYRIVVHYVSGKIDTYQRSGTMGLRDMTEHFNRISVK